MRRKPRVYIASPSPSYVQMFRHQGWKVLRRDIHAADLVQFTGGSDVSPAMYGEQPHPRTASNRMRDQREALLFNNARDRNIAMAGICRGAQFLNVMCGGKMWQHVEGHCSSHFAVDVRTRKRFLVTSTHHQMMKQGPHSELIMTACVSRRKEFVLPSGEVGSLLSSSMPDVEALYYPKQHVFCFQPHPEFPEAEELADIYFDYIEEFFHLRGIKR